MSTSSSGGAAFNPVVRTEGNAPARIQIPAWVPQEFIARLHEIRAAMGPDVIAALRQAHNDLAGCNAHGEGQDCCIDWLVDGGDNGRDVA